MLDQRDSPSRLRTLLTGLETPSEMAVPPLCPAPPLAFARGRVHELTGPARRTLAALLAGVAQAEGPVLWLRPGWRAEMLCPQGLQGLADPGALITLACPRATDILWSMEEALRAGCVALVVAEFTDPPDLRQLRRLHLAAAEGVARNQGAAGAGPAPLGLLLAHEAADSRVAGVESRWALHPQASARSWRLERLRARAAPPAQWQLRIGPQGAEITALTPE